MVVGASRGIGRACALALAKRGFSVAVAARTVRPGQAQEYGHGIQSRSLPGSLEETAEAVRAIGKASDASRSDSEPAGVPAGAVLARTVRMDLLDCAGCVKALREVISDWGRIDVLVCAAVYQGPGSMKRVLDLGERHYPDMLLANAVTPLALVREALPTMRRQRSGAVVMLSSSSINLVPRFAVGQGGWDFAYVSSKAALAKLVPLLALEHPARERPSDASDGTHGTTTDLRFFNVEPGLVRTEVMKASGQDAGFTSGYGDVPPEVAGEVVAFLCTDTSGKAAKLSGRDVYAPKLCQDLQLIPDYKERKPTSAASKL